MYISSVSVTLSLAVGVLANQRIFDVSHHYCPTISSSHSHSILSNSTKEHILHSTPYEKRKECSNPDHVPQDPPPLPWTQEPLCTETFAKGEPYCIFTSSTFANGRGMSLLTTPSIAADFAVHPAFTTHLMHSKIAAQSTDPFIQQKMPGKGLGLVATKTLYPGDRIFAYTPATIFHGGIYDEIPDDGEMGRIALQRETANRLPEELKAKWWALLGHFSDADGDNPIDLADDIINTNSFEENFGQRGKKKEHFVVLPETARINHDCRPNSQYYFDHSSFTHYVHATTTIHPGEELTISYTDPIVRRATRRRAIKRSWGFDCACSACTQSPALTRASDERIATIVEYEKLLDDWSSPANRKENGASPEMAEYIVELYELERLWAPRAEAYYRAALSWSAVGDAWKARIWAERGAKTAMVNTGPDSTEVDDMAALAESPTEHWSWRWMEGWDGEKATI